jgi:DNA topoisomerase-2
MIQLYSILKLNIIIYNYKDNYVMSQYKKLSHREHVRTCMEMYLGLREPKMYNEWVVEDDTMTKQNVYYSKALYKLIDEIVVNAIDQYTRTRNLKGSDKCTIIKCEFNEETGEINIYNNGKGIEIQKFEDEDIYIPEVIFSHAMSGSNFDLDENKITGGVNGLGSKIVNFCSEYFIINTIDEETELYYSQTFEDGNQTVNEPTIKKTKNKGYTQIIFKPEYELFYKKEEVDFNTIETIIKTRMYFTAVFCSNAKVYFNDELIKFASLEKFAQLIIPDKKNLVSTKVDDWDIVIGIVENTNGSQDQLSVINGIIAKTGGTHITKINKLITDNVKDDFAKMMKKKTNVNIKVILNNLFIFMKGYVVNPKWDSQSKDTLNTPVSTFKNYQIDEKVYKIIWKKLKPLLTYIYMNSELKDLEKVNGIKSKSIKNENLTDALWAGTSKAIECKLILTEGLSAATFAITGMSKIGRERYGCYPLKGKPLNVRGKTSAKITANKEITEIVQILGLKYNHKYESLNELRYGGVIFLADADTDGSHIKGLLINLFHVFWPELIKLDFIQTMITPIVKVNKGNKVIEFFTMKEYEDWNQNNKSGWSINYYKGLGTSTDTEILKLFETFDEDLITYVEDENIEDSINLAFNDTMADLRKDWLLLYDKDDTIAERMETITVSDFVNKDLIHFSYYDIQRSIPNIIDGMKITQRKVLYTSFDHVKDNSVKQKVAQLGARVAEKTCYMHGEASVFGTIIKMAQTFMGSNNCNLLLPKGQFGSRIAFGADHSSERYIFTNVNPVTYKLFRKEDKILLNYIDFENQLIEPEYYYPILPTVLINGALGIGTGFSTNVPMYNLEDIANIVIKKLKGKKSKIELIPYIRFFKGKIVYKEEGKYIAQGTYEWLDSKNQLIITELPPGLATKKYIAELNKMIYDKTVTKTQCLTDVIDLSTKNDILFKLIMKPADYKKIKELSHEEIITKFKLGTTISENNMYLFNKYGNIKKYDTPMDILNYHFKIRLAAYKKRKELQLAKLKHDMLVYKNKVRFINGIIAKEIAIMNVKKDKLFKYLSDEEYYQVDDSYDYLINMAISTLTKERVIKLENEYNNKVNDLKDLENTEVEDIWMNEILECVEEYKEYNKLLEKDL